MAETSYDLVNYYPKQLILQYLGLPNAYQTIALSAAPFVLCQTTVQNITFSLLPSQGSFSLEYGLTSTSLIQWNDTAPTVQSALRAISGLGSVTVTGSIDTFLTVTFIGLTPPVAPLTVQNNTLKNSDLLPVVIRAVETDLTIPLAIQNGFNLIGDDIAVGAQLDILGKYVGVTRSVNTPSGYITLDDTDFLTLIRFAIVQNNSGSSLSDIENNLNQFFPDLFLVTDFKNMYMSYILSQSIGSTNLFTVLVNEKLIPKPMGVGISVIIPVDVTAFFGFSSYDGLNPVVKPFNTYDDFNTSWLWLSYSDAVIV